ncbi:hypothetical protein MK489_02445 [Myxococcota bacterium]|nr:hypothetical protein [Myxococcota bacterium]
MEDADRPDRLGAVLDLVPTGDGIHLAVREARRGAVERSPRLMEIIEDQRRSMPVHITDVEDVLDADRSYRILLPEGEEHRVRGSVMTVIRAGSPPEVRRAPWLERISRALVLRVRAWKLRRMADGGPLRVERRNR